MNWTPPETYIASNYVVAGGVIELLDSDFASRPVRDFAVWSPRDGDARSVRPVALDALSDRLGPFEVLIRNRLGIPSSAIESADPQALLRRLERGEAVRIWCQQVGRLFYFWTTSRGMITRSNQAYDYVPGSAVVTMSGHVFNELYVSEADSWMLVDPTLGIYGVRDGRNKPVSAARFSYLMASRSFPPSYQLLLADRQTERGGLSWTPLSAIPDSLRQVISRYYDPHVRFIYNTPRSPFYGRQPFLPRVLSFLLFRPAAFIVNGDPPGNTLFYFYRSSAITAVLIGIALGAVAARLLKERLHRRDAGAAP